MNYKNIFLYISLATAMWSCKEDLKTSFVDTNITTKNNELVEINVPKAIENTPFADQINSEINKTIQSVLHIGEPNTLTAKTVEESITSFNKEYNDFNTDFPNVSQPWEAQIDGELMHQSIDIISIAITSYVNTGGAHGITHVSFLNFNTSTGKRITNAELIKNKKAFENIARTYLKDMISEDDALFEPNTFKLPENIGFNEKGVILLYNQYEIAPYSTGIIDFTIPIEKVNDYLAFNGA